MIFCVLVGFVPESPDIQAKHITVAADGTGDYKTVQAAFDAIPSPNNSPVEINIKKGFYKERLVLDSAKRFVSIIGEDEHTTILSFDNHTGTILPNGDTINTRTSASFFLYASDFSAKHITIDNNAGFAAGQAVALMAYGDRLKFENCRLTGFQDVLFCSRARSRQYFKNCYIEGTTDFIFGAATVVFDHCTIHSKKNSHVTAASTPRDVKFGVVFFDCTLTADDGIDKVTLGRPWRPFASVAYIRCNIGLHIIPAGWDNWRNANNEQTVRYSEYASSGAGANPRNRVAWAHQLSQTELREFNLKNIFGDWNP